MPRHVQHTFFNNKKNVCIDWVEAEKSTLLGMYFTKLGLENLQLGIYHMQWEI